MNGHGRPRRSGEASSVAGSSQAQEEEEDMFSFLYIEWHTMASSCPLIAAACGPVSNLFSITALAEPWVIELNDGEFDRFLSDGTKIIALNALSLAFGVFANLALLANFTGRVRYSLSQAISITSFYCASILLLAAVGHERQVYSSLVRDGLDLQFSQGYWSAVITVVLYFLCGFVLSWNLIGHLRGHYPASFILTLPQRSLMFQILCIMIWLAGGGAVYTGLEGYSYGDAVYFCDVTILTIGFGDLQPTNTVSRALVLPYALIGIVILGLVIVNVRSLVLVSSRELRSLNHIEHLRVRKLRRGVQLEGSDEESFNLMRNIHKAAKKRDMWYTLLWSTIMFLIFWFFSSLVFAKMESWSFFIGFYFCTTSLLTIGYGQYVPSNPGSKAFFVLWSLLAVPLMTMLITSLGNTVIAASVYVAQKLGDLFLKNRSSDLTTELSQRLSNNLESQESYQRLPEAGKNEVQDFNAYYNVGNGEDNERIAKERLLVDAIQGIVSDLRVDPQKQYSYEEWDMLSKTLGTQFNWLGKDSPIRFPINEPAFFLRLYWNSLKDQLTNRHVHTEMWRQPRVDMLRSGAESSRVRTMAAIVQATRSAGQEK
ncbi:hypothetical protein V1509DRAFT_572056 [Lipomyces kononenkoae]